MTTREHRASRGRGSNGWALTFFLRTLALSAALLLGAAGCGGAPEEVDGQDTELLQETTQIADLGGEDAAVDPEAGAAFVSAAPTTARSAGDAAEEVDGTSASALLDELEAAGGGLGLGAEEDVDAAKLRIDGLDDPMLEAIAGKPRAYPLQLGPNPPTADGYDWEACLRHPGAGATNGGRIQNRYVWCVRTALNVQVPGWRPFAPAYRFPVQVVGIGRKNARSIRIYVRKNPVEPIAYSRSSALSRRVTMRAGCLQSSGHCTTTGERRGDPAVTQTLRQWALDRSWHHWDVEATKLDTLGPEWVKRIDFAFEIFDSAMGPNEPIPSHRLRCDSAAYFADYFVPAPQYSYPEACVFDEVRPHLNYSLSDTRYNQVSVHLKEAFEDTTKNIPGKFVDTSDLAQLETQRARSLHRLYNQADIDRNRRLSQGECARSLPPRPTDHQCDEFPFASTEEGAANPAWSSSVKWVHKDHNRIAGDILRVWYVKDRILKHQPEGQATRDVTRDDWWVNVVQ